jgi:hypothetical protein
VVNANTHKASRKFKNENDGRLTRDVRGGNSYRSRLNAVPYLCIATIGLMLNLVRLSISVIDSSSFPRSSARAQLINQRPGMTEIVGAHFGVSFALAWSRPFIQETPHAGPGVGGSQIVGASSSESRTSSECEPSLKREPAPSDVQATPSTRLRQR